MAKKKKPQEPIYEYHKEGRGGCDSVRTKSDGRAVIKQHSPDSKFEQRKRKFAQEFQDDESLSEQSRKLLADSLEADAGDSRTAGAAGAAPDSSSDRPDIPDSPENQS